MWGVERTQKGSKDSAERRYAKREARRSPHQLPLSASSNKAPNWQLRKSNFVFEARRMLKRCLNVKFLEVLSPKARVLQNVFETKRSSELCKRKHIARCTDFEDTHSAHWYWNVYVRSKQIAALSCAWENMNVC